MSFRPTCMSFRFITHVVSTVGRPRVSAWAGLRRPFRAMMYHFERREKSDPQMDTYMADHVVTRNLERFLVASLCRNDNNPKPTHGIARVQDSEPLPCECWTAGTAQRGIRSRLCHFERREKSISLQVMYVPDHRFE